MKEYKFLIISILIFTVLLLLWTDYDNKQTAKMIKQYRIEAEAVSYTHLTLPTKSGV